MNTATRNTYVPIPSHLQLCVNCEHYRHYFTKNRGNLDMWNPTGNGNCVKSMQSKRPWEKCKNYEPVKPR